VVAEYSDRTELALGPFDTAAIGRQLRAVLMDATE
jgi:hypothetical protein